MLNPPTVTKTMPKLAVSKRDAARMLSISEMTLYTLTKRGEIAVVRLPGKLLYPVAELGAWLNRSKSTVTNAVVAQVVET